jgi:hypothetical protein
LTNADAMAGYVWKHVYDREVTFLNVRQQRARK